MTSNSRPPDATTQTRLKCQAPDAYYDPADQLFYLVGEATLLAVPQEDMYDFQQEMCLLAAVVEHQQEAVEKLESCQARYLKRRQNTYFNATTEEQRQEFLNEALESLTQKVVQAQAQLDAANQRLRAQIETLSPPDDPTNCIVELVPIQRRGAAASPQGFRLAYVRSSKILDRWRHYRASNGADAGTNQHNTITQPQVEWEKVKRLLSDIKEKTTISFDIPWFDKWLKLEDQEKELFQWSGAISTQTGEDHANLSQKVVLSADAQLMRWAYGGSSISGEVNPFKNRMRIKASGHAEVDLVRAAATFDCYEPPGGYMMAYTFPNRAGTVDLGMLRSHVQLKAEGRIGASIAAELNVEIELSEQTTELWGTKGSAREAGPPGTQRLDHSDPDRIEKEVLLECFAGAKVGATIAGQVEWKSPESERFEPFARISPGLAGQVGVGASAELGLSITYQEGKFCFLVRAGFCFCVGARGKLALEVDGSLLYEFAKWVAYQLKHIDYARLSFIDGKAFEALSNIFVLALEFGEELKNYMLDSAGTLQQSVDQQLARLQHGLALAGEHGERLRQGLQAARERGELVRRINADPDLLKYATPDAKGVLLHRLMQVNRFDEIDPANRTYDVTDINFWRFGAMTERKRAIINVFAWVQSQHEYQNVMQRITPVIGEKTSAAAGEAQLLEFLARGEQEVLSSDYPENLRNFYRELRSTPAKGGRIMRNDMTEYLTQRDIDYDFNRPCTLPTQCLFEPPSAQV